VIYPLIPTLSLILIAVVAQLISTTQSFWTNLNLLRSLGKKQGGQEEEFKRVREIPNIFSVAHQIPARL
jgi:hypothetical protein